MFNSYFITKVLLTYFKTCNWTPFWEENLDRMLEISKRPDGPLLKNTQFCYLPAGQNLCSGPSNTARFLLTGMLSSLRVKWAGWSCSWFVPLKATDDRRSKLIFPSGFGYSIGVQSLAGLSWAKSGPKYIFNKFQYRIIVICSYSRTI